MSVLATGDELEELKYFALITLLWIGLNAALSNLVHKWCDSEDCTLTGKLKDDFRLGAASYLVSLIHSLVVTARGCYHFAKFICAPAAFRVEPPLDPSEYYHQATVEVVATNKIFGSYLIMDMLNVIFHWPKLGKLDVIGHHLGFLSVSIYGAISFTMPFQFAWLILGELSTIFLDIRWLLIKTGRGDSKALNATNIVFALTFFVMRIVVYGAGLVDVSMCSSYLTRPSTLGKVGIFGGILVGYALNIFWFRKISQIAASGGAPKTEKKE